MQHEHEEQSRWRFWGRDLFVPVGMLSVAVLILSTAAWEQSHAHPLPFFTMLLAFAAMALCFGILLRRVVYLKRAQAERIERFLDNLAAGCVALDAAGRITFANLQARQIAGDLRDVLVGRFFWDLFPREFAIDAKTQLDLAVSQKQRCELEQSLDQADRWLRWTITPQFDGGAVCIAHDITQIKETEKSLRESESRFRAVFENATLGVSLTRLDGQFLQVNSAFANITGYSQDELKNLTFEELTFDDDVQETKNIVRNLMSGTHSTLVFRKRYRCKDGQIIWVEIRPSLLRDVNGSPYAFVAFIEDVSARKADTDALAHRASQLQKLAQTSLAINSAPTLSQVLQIGAERAAEIIGAHLCFACFNPLSDSYEVVKSSFRSDKYDADQHEALIDYFHTLGLKRTGLAADVCRTNQSMYLTQFELKNHHAWSQGFPGSLTMRGWLAAPLIGKDGRNIGLIHLSDKHEGDFSDDDQAILVQIAQSLSIACENARLYAALQEADRRKDEFLATLSHELRSPLNVIAGHSDLLRLEEPNSDEFWESIDAISRVTARVE